MTNLNITERHSLQLDEMYDKFKITEWYRLLIEDMYDKLRNNRVVDDDRTIAFSLMKCLTNLDITE